MSINRKYFSDDEFYKKHRQNISDFFHRTKEPMEKIKINKKITYVKKEEKKCQ